MLKESKMKNKLTYILRVGLMVLTVILIILFLSVMSLVGEIQGTARVVNYAGLVRGTTQRVIKLENAGQMQADMIGDIDSLLNDFNRDLSTYLNDLTFSEEDFDTVTKRLDLINHLKGKYGKLIL